LRDGLRSYLVHPYLVFYAVNADRKAVVLERVLHGAMDVRSGDFETVS
jgi:plasmid stabilization system protein ParE